MTRLGSLNADPIFTQIFNAKHTKVNFHTLINEPRVIVVNATRDLSSISKLYGRYFLALVKQAGERRPESPIPCFVYVDESDEFVDDNARDIILKLRRNRMALIVGNQMTRQIEPDVRQAFLGTSIKFVNGNEESAKELAVSLGLSRTSGNADIAELVGRPAFNFALHIAGETPHPVSYKFKPFQMNALPKMTEVEWEQVRADIRDRYYEPVEPISASPVRAQPQPQPARPKPEPPKPSPKASREPDTPAADIPSEGATGWDG